MANPDLIRDIIDVQATIVQGGGVAVQVFSDPIFVSEFAANASFPDRTKAYAGTLSQMQATLVADGFAANDAAYRQVTAAMVQQGPPDLIYIGRRDAGDINWTDALTSIWTYSETQGQSIYFFAADERDAGDIEQIADFAQTQFALYMAQTASAAVFNNQPGNVAANIIAKSYDRTALLWHDPAVASNYAPASLTGRTGTFALPSTSGTIEVRINGGALQTFTIEAFAATLLGSNTGPFVFASGDQLILTVDDGAGGVQTLTVSLTAASLLSGNAQTYDLTAGWTLLVRVNGGGSQTVTFAGTQGAVATGAATFALADLETVTFNIDGTGNQVVTFNTIDFANIALATAAELNAVYTTQLSGVNVSDDGSIVTVASSRFGVSSDAEIVAGTGGALAALGYAVANNPGTGGAANIAFLDTTTAVEAATQIAIDVAGVSSVDESGSVRISSLVEGKSSRLQVVGGLANGAFGFNTNEVSGAGTFNDGSSVPTSEVVTWLSAALFGLVVAEDSNAVRLTTRSRGTDSAIVIAASTVATTLGLAVGTVAPLTGDVGNAALATAGEVATKISDTIVDGTASAVSSAIVLASLVLGPTSSVEIVGGTYASIFFDELTASGTGTDEDYADCAWLGRCATFPLDLPEGQSTWDNQPLVGILPDAIDPSTRTVLHETLKTNTFEKRAGRNETHFGTLLFGGPNIYRYIDTRVTADWGDARITEAFKNQLNSLADAKKKAPYAAAGIALLENVFIGVLRDGETNGHWFYDGTDITGPEDTGIEIPTAAGQTQTNFDLRKVVGFRAQLAPQNAIHRVGAELKLINIVTAAA